MSIVGALWRGEVSLVKTGWLYGMGGLLALICPLVLLTGSGLSAVHRPLVLTLSASVLLYAAFIAVAVWRSAGNYQGAQAWRLLVKGSLLFVALQVLAGVNYG